MISRNEFDAYNKAVEQIGNKAASDVESSVLNWCSQNPAASVAEKREAAKLIMEGYVQGYDDIASEFAAEWYDHRAKSEGISLDQAITMAVYSPEKSDAVARYQARKLAKGGDAAFAKACGEYARNDAFRSLNETIIANVGRDKDKGAKFARVPTGFETCTFCVMLASRGAVYHTRKTAGEWKHFHRNCDCKVVPSFEDDPEAELVQGVKPRELYDLYKQFKEIDSYNLPRAQGDAVKLAACRASGFSSKECADFADALDAAISNATKEFRANGKSPASYDATVGRLLGLLGEQYGISMSGSWSLGTKGKAIFALPDGNEVWAMLAAMDAGDELVFLPQERDMAPDVRTPMGYAEIKTPRSIRKVADRLKHASEQLDAYGNPDGDVYLSLLRFNSDDQAAIDVAQRFIDDGTIENIHVIHGDGTIETLKKWTRASVLNQGARPFLHSSTSGRGGTGRRASFRSWRAQARAGSNPADPTNDYSQGY